MWRSGRLLQRLNQYCEGVIPGALSGACIGECLVPAAVLLGGQPQRGAADARRGQACHLALPVGPRLPRAAFSSRASDDEDELEEEEEAEEDDEDDADELEEDEEAEADDDDEEDEDDAAGPSSFSSTAEEAAYLRDLAQIVHAATGTLVNLRDVQAVMRGENVAHIKAAVDEIIGGADFTDLRAETAELQFEEAQLEDAMTKDELRAALRRINSGKPVTEGQLSCFVDHFGDAAADGTGKHIVTRKTVSDLEKLILNGHAQVEDVVGHVDESTPEGAEEMLRQVLSGLSEAAQQQLAAAAAADDGVLYFLIRHFNLLQKDPNTTLPQLLRVYDLHRQPVSRSFARGVGGALPPQVAWSAMKPLNTEVSYRIGTGIVLFPPQRVTLGAFVDFTKVVRPMRAKNLSKRLKHRQLTDFYHRE